MIVPTTLDRRAREAAASVTDPEMPMLTLEDLGVLRDVEVDGATVERPSTQWSR